MKVRMTLTGTSPLISHNVQLANPLNPIAKQMKAISGKRGKTEEDYEALGWLEYQGGLYYDDELGPYIPGLNIEACITEGAKASRDGKKVQSGLFILDDIVPILYAGPRKPEELYADANFVDVRAVRVTTSRVMRTRPIFRKWSLECEAEVDGQLINFDQLQQYVDVAGATKALGDYRPRFGRFTGKVERL